MAPLWKHLNHPVFLKFHNKGGTFSLIQAGDTNSMFDCVADSGIGLTSLRLVKVIDVLVKNL